MKVDEQLVNGVNKVDGPQREEADHTECFTIQSFVRSGPITSGGTDGNLLRAQPDGSSKIAVDFTGTDLNDPTTVFHLEKSDDIEGNVVRCSVTSNDYYLGVYKSGKVKLRHSEHFPTKYKYLFHVERIHDRKSPATFKSLRTGEHLHCDEDGKAFMKKVTATDDNGKPKDRQTWFRLEPCSHTSEQTIHVKEECMLFTANMSLFANTKEEFVNYKEEEMEVGNSERGNSEDSGKGYSHALKEGLTFSRDSKEGNWKDPIRGNFIDPVEGNFEDPVNGYNGDVGEGNSEDFGDRHMVVENSKYPEEGTYEGRTECPGKGNSNVQNTKKMGNSEDSGYDNTENPGKVNSEDFKEISENPREAKSNISGQGKSEDSGCYISFGNLEEEDSTENPIDLTKPDLGKLRNKTWKWGSPKFKGRETPNDNTCRK